MNINFFEEYEGLSYSSIVSIALKAGKFEAVLDFLESEEGQALNEHDKHAIDKVFDLYLEFLATSDKVILERDSKLLTSIKQILLKNGLQFSVGRVTEIEHLKETIWEHLESGGKLSDLAQRGFHTSIKKPGSEISYYTTDELLRAYLDILKEMERPQAERVQEKQLEDLSEVKTRRPLIHFALKEIEEIVI